MQKNKCLDETSIGEIYIEGSRTEPQINNTLGKNEDYYKNTKDHSDIEIAYSARSSGTIYKYIIFLKYHQ